MMLAAAIIFAQPMGAAAQGNPTGSIRGHVLDPNNLPMPGVAVTARSPVLPGTRTTLTSANGDFILVFLPPGEYSVAFEREGFEPHTRAIVVTVADALPTEIQLVPAGVTQTIEVGGTTSSEISKTPRIAETYKAPSLERLPVGRTLDDAVLLAPGVNANGPLGHIVISGALSYENLFLVNGVVINDFLSGTPVPLYIEDAIEETQISRGNISAEYGRFQGGVVSMITKSGGNQFSGSFRTSFANDAWRALTPYPGDQTIGSLTPTFELTGGGPMLKDKLWFFAAGRLNRSRRNVTLDFTSVNYILVTDDKRADGKLTYALNPKNSVKASYTTRTLSGKNRSQPNGMVMDLASLYDDETESSQLMVNYTSALTDRVFLEGQYSATRQATTGVGSRFSDLVNGTPIADRARSLARFNSPIRCNVCGGGWLERRDNRDWFVQLDYFLSTQKVGTHHIVAGFDGYKEMRKNDNWQSGSGYEIQARSTNIDGATIYPVFDNENNTYINYFPLVAESVGNDVRTYSAFVNDAWQYHNHLSFNLGIRYDQHRSSDQTGIPVVKARNISPRLGLSWNVNGDGKWIVHTGFARYVMEMFNLVVDAGSAGGRTANYTYFYQGPPINTGSGQYVTADQALPILFDWFFANGGLNRPTRNAPVIPGLTRHLDSDMKAPNSYEYSAGLTSEIGHRGVWRADYIYRTYHDMYGDVLDTATGRVADAAGNTYDVALVRNQPDAKRTYQGLTASVSYHMPSVQLGGNYTLSWSRSNVDGEGPSTMSFRTMISTYPEYRRTSWNSPMGYTANDQRHKARAWFSYRLPVPASFGQLYLGFLQRFDSALPYDTQGPVDSRRFVINPGYVTPPSTVTYYFSPRNGLRWDSAWNTDVSVNWATKIPWLGTTEVYLRGVVTNVFNNSAVVSGDATILTAASPGAAKDLLGFNPFTDTPMHGVHWTHGPSFGQPTGTGDYQVPRTFSCSVGIRF